MNEHWQILVAAVTIMAILDTASLWAVRFIIARFFADQRDQYRYQLKEAADKCEQLTRQMDSFQAIERQVLEIKAILPLEYVRKEDFIRHEVVINAKLDRIMDRLQGGGEWRKTT